MPATSPSAGQRAAQRPPPSCPCAGTAGFPGGSISSPQAPAWVSSPALLFCRYRPLKTTPRRSSPCPHSEAAWTCLPEFPVLNSLFKWGPHLAWSIRKGYPNSFTTEVLPYSLQSASCLEHVYLEPKQQRMPLPEHLSDKLWGSEDIPGTPQRQPFSSPCACQILVLTSPLDVHTMVGKQAEGQ